MTVTPFKKISSGLARLELKIPPPVVQIVFALLMWLCAFLSPGLAVDVGWGWRLVCALPFLLLGFAIFLASGRQLMKSKTTVNPRKPEKAAVLVVSGLYCWSRNPLYLGDLFMLVGWALFLGNLLPFLWLPLFKAYLTRFQIKPEERALIGRFGLAYLQYMARVRRWI